jgi:hypothetical protein
MKGRSPNFTGEAGSPIHVSRSSAVNTKSILLMALNISFIGIVLYTVVIVFAWMLLKEAILVKWPRRQDI